MKRRVPITGITSSIMNLPSREVAKGLKRKGLAGKNDLGNPSGKTISRGEQPCNWE
jgi:hypothetical protein